MISLNDILTTLRISPYSVRMRENTNQNNSKYGHFLRSENFIYLEFQPTPGSEVYAIGKYT